MTDRPKPPPRPRPRTGKDRVVDDRVVDDRVVDDRADDHGVLDGVVGDGVILDDVIIDDDVHMPPLPPPLPSLVEQVAEPLVPAPDSARDAPLDPAITTEVPLLLLPIRLETRYSEDRSRLRIRIYPDQVHLDTGIAPTAAELDHARTFWQMRADDRAGELQTFGWLVDRVGSRRAGYLARLTEPTRTARGLTFPDIEPQTVAPPARVCLMPHHFVAIGWHKDREIFRVPGLQVPDDLVTSPDPSRVGITLGGSGLRTDPAMAWMFDYATAEKNGMAITVDLSGMAADGATEVTTLLVLGVAATDAKASAGALAELLDAHQRAGDLAFVQQGTPTNNTDSVAAGYTRHERELADLERRELDDPERDGLVFDNAECFATALGLEDARPLRHVAFGVDDETVRSRAMRTALFEATLGTFVREALPIGVGLTTPVLPSLREWFVDEVTGGAPIPSIRIRNQPYGILPIAAPSAPASSNPTGQRVAAIVDTLRNEWRFAARNVVRLDHDAIDAAGAYRPADIGTVLAGEPHPTAFAGRGADEFEYVETSGPFAVSGLTLIGADGEVEWIEWQNGYRGEWEEGLEWLLEETPHVYEEFERFFAQYAAAVDIDGQLARWIAFRDLIDTLSRPQVVGGASQSWRYLPEAVEALPVIDDQLAQLWAHERRQRPLRWLGVDPYAGVLGEENNQLLVTRFDWSAKTVDRPIVEPTNAAPDRRAAAYLDELHAHRSSNSLPFPLGQRYDVPDHAPLLQQLIGQTVNRIRVDDLPSLTTLAGVDPLLLEWHTRETLGLGTHRLDAWATSLVTQRLRELRFPDGAPVPGSEGPASPRRTGIHVGAFGWVTNLRPRDADANQGFIHTPSMTHAATAAILRSAWFSRGAGTALAPAAVDIQSARMRIAEWLLDGVRNGQPLGELLGYRLERYLHEIQLDALIAPMRTAVGAGQDPPEPTSDDPVDGLDALELWRAGTLYDAWPVADHPPPTDAQKAAVAFGLGLLELAFDATDDATLFEATHQLVSGNLERAAAVIQSMGDVDLAPPELVAQRTPSAGPTVDHRVMVLIDAETEPDGTWADGLRGALAPQLEAWVTTMLPDPAGVGFRIGEGRDATGARLDSVDVSALDAVALAGDDPQTVGPGLRELVRLANPDLDVTLIDATDPAGAPVSLAELQLLAIELRRLIDAARSAEGRDLRPSDVTDPAMSTVDPVVAEDAFTAVRGRLATAAANSGSAGAELARFGIVAPPDDAGTLADLAAARLQAVDDAAAAGTAAADLVAIALGRGLPLLSPVSGGTDAVQLGTAIAGVDDIERWIDLVAPVRPGVGRLAAAQQFAELLDPTRTPSFVTGQLPFNPGDRWAATSAPPPSTGGRVVVTASTLGTVDTTSTNSFVGLVLDRWSELVPAADQVTGVAVHHDAPSNRPPQSWLLALPPAKQWTVNELAGAVLDALEWAQLRAVAVEDLGDFGHAIPTVMVPDDLLTDPIEELAS
jgi:hypothetical protein